MSVDEYAEFRKAQQEPGFIDPEIIEIVKRYLNKLKENGVNVTKGVLFGSRAGGDKRPDVDIDLAILSPDFGKDKSKDIRILGKAIREVDARIDPVAINDKRYYSDEDSLTIPHIKNEGYEITV